MDLPALVRTDLNLLVTLYVLFEERSVSRAAERLFVTQSAVSKALGRLRELFGDPLFTRAGHRLVATPFLESLAPQLVSTLNDITGLLQPADFDPRTCSAQVKLTLPETLELVVMPRLAAYLQQNAPGVRLKSQRYGPDMLERLSTGELDFAIGLEYAEYPPDIRVQKFIRSYPVIYARSGHPLEGPDTYLTEVVRYPRISVKLPDESLTDFYRRFTSRGEGVSRWKASLETESLLSALSIIRVSDYLMPAPDIVAKTLLASPMMKVLNLPEYREMVFAYVLVSHKRTTASAMHSWMEKVLMSLAHELAMGK